MKRVEAVIDLAAMRANADMMHAQCPDTGMIAVIKADGYGHGAVPSAKMLEKLPYITAFAVATAEEGFALRDAGIEKPIVLLGISFPEEYEEMIRRSLVICVSSAEEAKKVGEAALACGTDAKILCAVDTGMRRIGVYPDEKGAAEIEKMVSVPHVCAEGIFTHFARADESDLTSAGQQLAVFEGFLALLRARGITFPLVTASNSAGILTLPGAHFSAVRLGILLYGLLPSDEIGALMRERGLVPHPVMSIRSHVVFVKKIRPGDAVGYGGTYVADSERVIATVPVGYADGYPRNLSGKAEVLIRGRRVPLVGRICMDQFMADVTSVPETVPGDEVVLVGRMGNEEIGIEELAALSGRFNYEFACDITGRVPRVYEDETEERY